MLRPFTSLTRSVKENLWYCQSQWKARELYFWFTVHSVLWRLWNAFFFSEKDNKYAAIKANNISDTLCLTGAGVSVGASGFCCELRLLPNKKQKLEEAWVLFPPFTAMLVMFDYKKVPNLGPGHCLDTKGFACISFSCLHFLIKFVFIAVFRGPRQSFTRCSQRRSASTRQNSAWKQCSLHDAKRLW